MMKNAMKSIIPNFNTQRMLTEYITQLYEPTAERALLMSKNQFNAAFELGSWKKKIASRFSTLKILEVRLHGLHGDVVKIGTELKFSVRIECSELEPDDILVELIILIGPHDQEYSCTTIPFVNKENHHYYYNVTFTPTSTGTIQYGVRVLPHHPALGSKYETGLVFWS